MHCMCISLVYKSNFIFLKDVKKKVELVDRGIPKNEQNVRTVALFQKFFAYERNNLYQSGQMPQLLINNFLRYQLIAFFTNTDHK